MTKNEIILKNEKSLFQFSYFKIFIIIFHTKWIGIQCLIISSRCIMTKMYIKKSKFNASPQDSSYVSTLSITYQSDMADFLPTTILSFFFTGNLIGQIGIRFTEQYLDSEHRLNIWLKHLEFYPIVRGINYSSLMSVLCMWDNIIERKRFRICPQIREVNSIRSDGTSPIVLRCVLFSTFVLLFLR